jgi:hypothetical protein
VGIDQLPLIDEHSIEVAAGPDAVFDAAGLLVLAGKHRFSRYGIVFRVTPLGSGSTLSAESRAEFPGLSGRAYQAMVIGTRGHVLATRGLLRTIARSARRQLGCA